MNNLQQTVLLMLVLTNCCFCLNVTRLHINEEKSINFKNSNIVNSDAHTSTRNQTAYLLGEENSSFDVKFSDESSINNTELEKITENSEQNSEVYSMSAKIVLISLSSIASLITISGNLLVMISFFLDRQIRNPTNYFILSLSVSDFLIGLVSMPLYTLYLMLGKWPFGIIICNLYLSLDYTFCLVSIYTVLFITIDRFCSVKIPAKYRKWRSPNKIIIMVAFTWILPILIFFPSTFGWTYVKRTEIDPSSCVAAWNKNIVYSVLLILLYFWSTLIVIIVLYIFIYQVALNLEKKSREKQTKISSLVGCSASNTATMVGAVALPSNIPHVEKLNTDTPEEDQEDDFNTDSQSKLSKASIKNNKKERLIFLRRSVKNPIGINEARSTNDKADFKTPNRIEIKKEIFLSNKNPENITNLNQTGANSQKIINDNLLNDRCNNFNNSFRSKKSREDEFSSSYDSHSDCEIKNLKRNMQTINSDLNFSYPMDNQELEKKLVFNDKDGEATEKYQQCLQPRPETLAIISHDFFSENFSEQSSNNLYVKSFENKPEQLELTDIKNLIKNGSNILISSNDVIILEKNDKLCNVNNIIDSKTNQIPFIDDEFDELSYILHRRQFGDKECKIPIKEETILIKSPLKTGFLQKFASPIRSLSRKSSQKSQSDFNSNSSQKFGKYEKVNKQSNLVENKSKIAEFNLNLSLKENSPVKPKNSDFRNDTRIANGSEIKNEQNEAIILNAKTNDSSLINNGFKNYENSKKPTNLGVVSNLQKLSPSSITTALTLAANSPITQICKSSYFPPSANDNKKQDRIQNTTASKIYKNNENQINSKETKAPAKRKKYENRARKALRTITFILGAFVMCFAPFHVVAIFDLFCEKCSNYAIYNHSYNTSYFLCYLNSPINPFMYALANQQFRKTFLRILKGDWRRL